ncbi:SAM-dependent methyltransferase [Thermocatellispora tengchongensis]
MPSVARIYDYYLGGKDNFAVDREAAKKIIEILPNVGEIARENRYFLERAVTYLSEQGVRQFLDIGAGLPTQRNVHQVAQELAPGSRVVYVDNDPIVLAHARAILAENEDVIAVEGDMLRPREIVEHPDVRAHLDFSQPVGLLLLAVLHFVPDDDQAVSIVRTLSEPLVPDSHLVISHASIGPVSEEDDREAQAIYSRTSAPGVASRTPEQVEVFFAGLDLAEPGVVPLQDWRPTVRLDIAAKPGEAGAVGGVARIP